MNQNDKCIVTINGKDYNVTEFQTTHPGGSSILQKFNSKDATNQFNAISGHSSEKALSLLSKYLIPPLMVNEDIEPARAFEDEEVAKTQNINTNLETDSKSSFFNNFIWMIFSSVILIIAISLGSLPSNVSWIDAITNGIPKTGDHGYGRFQIAGKTNEVLRYPWRLQVPTIEGYVSAWSVYFFHQIGQFLIIFAAIRAKNEDKIGWSDTGNKYGTWMQYLNITFVVLHYIQGRIWYDGLASSVPEVTAQGSVICLLIMVYLVEIPRRGLFFGKMPYRNKPIVDEFVAIVKRYHSFVASFGMVYNFHYHPFEPTMAHMTGFFYKFLLLWQSTLLFNNKHRNRYWTFLLEIFVMLHGVLTAIFQGGKIFLMFGFGFMFAMVITQIWGLPFIQNFINNGTGLKTSQSRYRLVLVLSLLSYFSFAGASYAASGEFKKLWMIINIPAVLYVTCALFFVGYLIALGLHRGLMRVGFKSDSRGVFWFHFVYCGLYTFGVMCTFAVWFMADLKVPTPPQRT